MKPTRRQLLTGGAAAAALTMAGCGRVGSSTQGGRTRISFWSWAAGMDVIVDRFNESQSEITVKLSPGGTNYPKLESAVRSGTGPDLAQVEFMMVPSLAISGTLQNVASLAGIYQNRYPTAVWKGSGFVDQHYGIPNDSGPLVTYINQSILDSIKREAPTTWDEYRDLAQKLRTDKKIYAGTLLTNGTFLSALASQAGAQWFETGDDEWIVRINDDATIKALNFWFRMAKDDLVNVNPGFNAGFWSSLDDGTIASYTVGAWGYRGMKGNLKQSAGKWHVTDVPHWDGTNAKNAPYGGSIWAVTKNSSHPDAALKFADWLASDSEALNLQFQYSGFYPSSGDTASIKGYDEPDQFFAGDALGPVFKQAASDMRSDWQWGPSMTSVFTMLQDRLNEAIKSGSSESMLAEVQRETVTKMRDAGLKVSER